MYQYIVLRVLGRLPYLNHDTFTQMQNTITAIQRINIYMVKPALCRINFKRRIKSHLPFQGINRSSTYSTSFQDKG